MKTSERLVWTFLALGAFFVGSGGHFGGTESTGANSTAKASGDRSSTGVGSALSSNSELSRAERATLVERTALASPLRTGRFMGMMAALDQVKPDTWQSMWEEFKRQTSEDGRVHEVEWSLFMNRVGEVDGADAMAFFEKNGQPEYTFNRANVLYGWAAADPKAAIRWMEDQPADSPNQSLHGTLLSGIVQSDPDLAMSLLAKAPAGESQGLAKDLVDDIIQAKGIQWAMDHIVALGAGAGGSPAYQATMEREITSRVERMSWLAGDSKAVDTWQAKRGGAQVTKEVTPDEDESER